MRKVQFLGSPPPTCNLVMQGTAYGKQIARQEGGTSFLASDVAFGDAHSTRIIAVVLCIAGDYSTDIPAAGVLTGLSIGGEAASVEISSFEHNSNNYVQTTIGWIKKPAGTSGTVEWTAAIALNDSSDSFCGIYRIKFPRSTPVIDTADVKSAAPASVSLDVPNKAGIIAGFISRTGGNPSLPTRQDWTGLTPDSLLSFGVDGDYLPSGILGNPFCWFAHESQVAADSTYDLSCTGSTHINCLAAMSLR